MKKEITWEDMDRNFEIWTEQLAAWIKVKEPGLDPEAAWAIAIDQLETMKEEDKNV